MRLRAAVALCLVASVAAGTIAYFFHAQRYTGGDYTRDGAELAWMVALVVAIFIATALLVLNLTGSARNATAVATIVAMIFLISGLPRNAAESIVRYGFGPDGGRTLTYVALGDSYASGEGVPPFDPQSDANGCHRSQEAYARVLDARSSAVDLVHFAACSGATTDTVLHSGQNGEAPQIQQLQYVQGAGTSVELVTITVGGNPVFREAALDCLLSDCTNSTIYLRSYFETSTFTDGLRQTYQSIKASGSRLVVLTYPRPFPRLGDSQQESPCTGRLIVEGVAITAAEIRAINALVTRLNEQITQVALSEGAFVVDVGDAFSDHELCGSGDSYLNAVNLVQREYSFHPNRAGQERLASELEDALNDADLL